MKNPFVIPFQTWMASRFNMVVLFVMMATAVFSQRSYEFIQCEVSSDLATVPTVYTIEKTSGQHHCVLLIQKEDGWSLKTWCIQDTTLSYDSFVLDNVEQAIFSGNTPWFDYFFSNNDGMWDMTEIWNATSQMDVPVYTKVYLNWVIVRHSGIQYKYLESATTVNTSYTTSVQTIKTFLTPR